MPQHIERVVIDQRQRGAAPPGKPADRSRRDRRQRGAHHATSRLWPLQDGPWPPMTRLGSRRRMFRQSRRRRLKRKGRPTEPAVGSSATAASGEAVDALKLSDLFGGCEPEPGLSQGGRRAAPVVAVSGPRGLGSSVGNPARWRVVADFSERDAVGAPGANHPPSLQGLETAVDEVECPRRWGSAREQSSENRDGGPPHPAEVVGDRRGKESDKEDLDVGGEVGKAGKVGAECTLNPATTRHGLCVGGFGPSQGAR